MLDQTLTDPNRLVRVPPDLYYYSDKLFDWAEAIVDGRIASPFYVYLSAKRFLKDYDKSLDDPNYPYEFDIGKVWDIGWFCENLPYIEVPEEMVGTFVELMAFCIFIMGVPQGWVHKSGRKKGKRRYRKSYIEVPRGNMKSFLASLWALFATCRDGEGGPQVFSVANSRKQARTIFDVSRAMIMHPTAKGLRKQLGITSNGEEIEVSSNFARYEPLAAKPNCLDGKNVHYLFVDELHASKNRLVWDVMVSGAKKRQQSMIVVITTAGTDLGSVGYEQHTYAKQVMEGVLQDDTYFAIIWTPDTVTTTRTRLDGSTYDVPPDDWKSEATWIKCNPGWGVSVDPESYIAEAKAAAIGLGKANFLTKHLNTWVKNSFPVFDIEALKNECWKKDLAVADHATGYIGIDLGQSSDLTAMVALFPTWEETESQGIKGRQLVVRSKEFIYATEAMMTETPVSSYRKWAEDGLITIIPGNVIDYNYLKKDLYELVEKYTIKGIGYDGWNAQQLVTELYDAGLPMYKVSQSSAIVSAPTKELQRLIAQKKFYHNNPMTIWMASNCVSRPNPYGNLKVEKEDVNSANKIDVIAATIDAVAVLQGFEYQEEIDSYVTTANVRTI
jgi:phage terminase large subunit-like protein